MEKKILDVTCGARSIWFNKHHPAAVYCDKRREQVGRMRGEWQVCFEEWRKQIAGDQCSKCGFQHYGTSINHYHFCPACGAPMTDEAVQMVMERLNKMEETKK